MVDNFYPDVYILFPAGAGGTFLTTLLIHRESDKLPLVDPTGEYRLDNVHWERAGNKLFARGHVPKQAKYTIAITSNNLAVRNYTNNLCRIKRFLSTQDYFYKLQEEELKQKVMDRFGPSISTDFIIDSSFKSRFREGEGILNEKLGSMVEPSSLLAYKYALQPDLSLGDILQYDQSAFIQDWDVEGDVTYNYEDIFFNQHLDNTVFSGYENFIAQYTRDNINAMRAIDRALKTNFCDSIPFEKVNV